MAVTGRSTGRRRGRRDRGGGTHSWSSSNRAPVGLIPVTPTTWPGKTAKDGMSLKLTRMRAGPLADRVVSSTTDVPDNRPSTSQSMRPTDTTGSTDRVSSGKRPLRFAAARASSPRESTRASRRLATFRGSSAMCEYGARRQWLCTSQSPMRATSVPLATRNSAFSVRIACPAFVRELYLASDAVARAVSSCHATAAGEPGN
mmetsp:Transcript_5419/g.17531  ORF Transcript_5419/g.17531 Transcript_5419/m.17531 type:complete len:202 (+) Transcript_5419:1094-1699(+)